ncbi:putative hydrogenase 2 b cytochrome subunit [Slackia heliotrinireducens]|uniref:Polysulphide reductase n=1 Tax=Slackia heliotrinireducens (strain ATCC 29202 / DSM 20476 / NCTC 11029 / RHS 1) TaxID=471855 RepID=C7N1L6_SLAHD|nr:NrfD/PsrC family molybdoenzyme membrane anchor subunit [Slackia heliotrinireducens]ACV21308.1 polysulphide reductase [Slackia heliotrinireducens DSM 20476]VEG98743.1 putative hydrogenase 2 b cytochrome subunit [Slackia heliotrinireducens]
MSSFVNTLKTRGLAIPLCIAAVLSAAGLALWIAELAGVTGGIGTNDATPWGSYLMVFILFVGLGAGSALIAALGSVFNVKACEPFVVPGIVMAVAFVAVAGLAIIMDLGNPANIMAMLLGLNLRSVLAWDMIFLTLFLVVTVIAFASLLRSSQRALSRGMGLAVLVAAVLLLVIDALLFQVESAREAWHSAVLVPWFFATALTSATALMMLIGALASKRNSRYSGSLAPLSKLLILFVCLDLAFLIVDVLFGITSSNTGDAVVASAMISGELAPFFWGQVVLYAAALAVLAGPAAKGASWAFPCAAVLVLLGVFAKRVDFILGGFFEPGVALPVAEGLRTFTTGVSYAPTWSEFGICLGFFAMAAFLAIVGTALAEKN